MDRDEVIKILTLLSEGTNPETGEVYDQDSPYQNPKVVRTLFHAVRLLGGNGDGESAGEKPKKEREEFEVPPLDDSAKELQGILRKWRTETAISQKLPAYMILENKAIAHIAYVMPKTLVQLQKAYGVGLATVEKYGEAILKIIREHDAGESRGETVPSTGDDWKTTTDAMQRHNADANRPLRAYAPWAEKEDVDLRRMYREGKNVQQMADYFERQPGAIRSRLEKLGLK